MTRAEQILEKSCEYSLDDVIYTKNPSYHTMRHLIAEAFIDGTEWADEHPESPWIKFMERKPDTMCLVLVYHDEEAFTAYFKEFYGVSYWRVNGGLIEVSENDYWMLIPKLNEE